MAGKSATFEVAVKNTQNVSVSATLVANISNNWTIDPASTPVTVPANSNQTVKYTITAPSNAKVGDTTTVTITGGKTPLTITAKVVSGEKPKGGIPGFEAFTLIGAILVASIILRRKR